MDENAIDFQEFDAAFGADEGNQTDAPAENEENLENTEQETENAADEGSNEAQEADTGDSDGENPEADTNDAEENKPSKAEQTFTIRVNKEDKTVTREEMIALAQKGADYDRVKGQVEKGKAEHEALSKKYEQSQKVYSMIEKISKEMGTTVPKFMQTMRVNQLMQKENLPEDVAREKVLRMEAEEKLEAVEKESHPAEKSEEDLRKERLDREMAEFQKLYPDVPIADLPVKEMAPYIAQNMTMAQSYQRVQSDKKDAQIEALQKQLKAAEQNKKNKLSSPGSASDSGARKQKTPFDDFEAAFK